MVNTKWWLASHLISFNSETRVFIPHTYEHQRNADNYYYTGTLTLLQ